jgi:hypothetical protein
MMNMAELYRSGTTEKVTRYLLGILLGLVAVNAFGGGYYGMAGARNVPTEWLQGSLFRDYFIPSLILFLGIGGSSLVAAVAVFGRFRRARLAAFSAGMLILIWLAVQVAIIGYVSWMQPATATAAVLILLLTWFLPKTSDQYT